MSPLTTGAYLRLCLEYLLFLFNKILYKQIDGLSMGNPIAPSLANIFLCHLETILFRNCPNSFKPIFYRRYLDDTFVIFEEESQVTCFLNYINSLHDNIQFTVERENENKLAFLDVSVERLDDSFNLSIFRKPTHTSLGLSYFSYVPLIYKINAIKSLIHRAYHLYSNFNLFNSEIENLNQYFNNNGYPLRLVQSITKKFLNKIFTQKQLQVTVPKEKIFIPLQYFGSPSQELIKIFKNNLANAYPQIEFKFCFNNSFKISSFFRFKDKLPASCVPTLYINLLVIPARNRTLGVQGSKQKSDSVSTLQFPLALIIL